MRAPHHEGLCYGGPSKGGACRPYLGLHTTAPQGAERTAGMRVRGITAPHGAERAAGKRIRCVPNPHGEAHVAGMRLEPSGQELGPCNT
jgi:hypothetical protein